MVLNGNGRTGAAAAAASRVRSRGYRIGSVGNAPSTDFARSLVMYQPGFAGEGQRLAQGPRRDAGRPARRHARRRARPRPGRLHPRRVARGRADRALLLRLRRGAPSPPPVTCAACGTSHWLNPKPCANAIVVDEDTVLLARRATRPGRTSGARPAASARSASIRSRPSSARCSRRPGSACASPATSASGSTTYADEPGRGRRDVINVAYYRAEPARRRRGRLRPGAR